MNRFTTYLSLAAYSLMLIGVAFWLGVAFEAAAGRSGCVSSPQIVSHGKTDRLCIGDCQ